MMLIGNTGVITAVSSPILPFVNGGGDDRYLSQLIDWAIRRGSTIEIRDFAGLLGIGADYEIVEEKREKKQS